MFRGLTPSRTARSWPLHSRGGWLVMIAVTRSCRVGGRGGAGVVRSRRVRPGLRCRGGVLMVVTIGVVVAGWGGGLSSRVTYREVEDLALWELYGERPAGMRLDNAGLAIDAARAGR